jgi:hypothetical protein
MFSDQVPMANLKLANLKGCVYDPNDILKTTIRETTLNSSSGTLNSSSRYVGQAHDPNDVARTTLKEDFFADATFAGSLHQATSGHTTYDRDDVPLPTLKDLFGIDDVKTGNVSSLRQDAGGYSVVDVQALPTHREAFTENRRANASAHRGQADGYGVAKVEAPDTLRQDHTERTGNASSKVGVANEANYQSMYNAVLEDKVSVEDYAFANVGANEGPSLMMKGETGRSERRTDASFQNTALQSVQHRIPTQEQDFKSHLRQGSVREPPGPFDVARPEMSYNRIEFF